MTEQHLTKNTQKFLNELAEYKLPQVTDDSIDEMRKFLDKIQTKYHKDIEADITDTSVFTPTAGNVEMRIVRPKDNNEKLPVILYIHGGGWVMGNKNTHDVLIRRLANCTNSAIFFPEYALSPDAKFPTAITQIYAVLEYIYNNPDLFNIDETKIAIAGDSVGACMATIIAMMAKKENGPKISFQVLFYPVTTVDMNFDSYKEFKDGPWLTKKAMEYYIEAYLSDKNRINEWDVSPLKASVDDLKNLPPSLVITAENDVLRDEGEAYAELLDKADVDVMSVRINGTIHDFLMLNALADTAPVKAALKIACKVLFHTLHDKN